MSILFGFPFAPFLSNKNQIIIMASEIKTGFQMSEVWAFQAEGTAKVLTLGMYFREAREAVRAGKVLG